MKKFFHVASGILSTLAFVVICAILIYEGAQGIKIDRDVRGWQEMATTSSGADDVHGYLVNLQQGMEKWGMTSGYSMLPSLKQPQRSLTLIYHIVKQYVTDAERLAEMDSTNPEVQTGLVQLQRAVAKLEIPTGEFIAWHTCRTASIVGIAALIALVVFGLIWLETGPLNEEED